MSLKEVSVCHVFVDITYGSISVGHDQNLNNRTSTKINLQFLFSSTKFKKNAPTFPLGFYQPIHPQQKFVIPPTVPPPAILAIQTIHSFCLRSTSFTLALGISGFCVKQQYSLEFFWSLFLI